MKMVLLQKTHKHSMLILYILLYVFGDKENGLLKVCKIDYNNYNNTFFKTIKTINFFTNKVNNNNTVSICFSHSSKICWGKQNCFSFSFFFFGGFKSVVPKHYKLYFIETVFILFSNI